MWLITEEGFVSVVGDRDVGGGLLVRARARKDLEAFCRVASEAGIDGVDVSGIWEDPVADYRWRLKVDQETFAELAATMIRRIDYGNFKSRVGMRDPNRASIYADVWETLLPIQRSD